MSPVQNINILCMLLSLKNNNIIIVRTHIHTINHQISLQVQDSMCDITSHK